MKVVLSSIPLYVAPLLVALAAMAVPLFWRRPPSSETRAPSSPAAPRYLLAFAMASALAVLLVSGKPLIDGQRVFSHALRLMRVGSLDASLDFWLDEKAFALGCAILIGGILAVLTPPRHPSSTAAQAGVGMAIAGVLVAALADGFPTLLMGVTVFGVSISTALRRRSPRAARRVLAATLTSLTLLGLASALIFWGLSGRFLDGRRYLADYRAPFVASSKLAGEPALPNEAVVNAPNAGERGVLTMLTHPGAKIYLGLANESQLNAKSEPVAISPVVRLSIPAGLQKVAIDTGSGAVLGGDGRDIALIEQVRFPPGAEVEIRSVGGSLSFHEIAATFASEPKTFDGRMLGPLSIAAASSWALGLGALCLAFGFGRRREAESSPRDIAVASALAALLLGSLGARAAEIFARSLEAPPLIAMLALLAACYAALRSWRAWSAAQFLADASRGWLLLIVAVSVLSASAASISLAVASAFGLLGLGLVIERSTTGASAGERAIEDGSLTGQHRNDRLALGFAALALGGIPVPLLGTFVGVGTLGAVAFARGGMTGILVAMLGASAWAALAYSSYRAYFCISHANASVSKKDEDPRPSSESPANVVGLGGGSAMLVGVLACVSGPLVALSLGALESPAGLSLTARVLGYVVLAIPALISGHLARRRYAADRATDWSARDRSGWLARFDQDAVSGPTWSLKPLARAIRRLDSAVDAPLDWLARRISRTDDFDDDSDDDSRAGASVASKKDGA